MTQALPPLNALRAFEAVARHISITRAARELHVTHAAVSQQIKLLESYLNVSLLNREGKQISLTAVGKTYAAHLNTAFSHVKHATLQLLNQSDTNILTIRVPPTLALHWFIPRMQHFQSRNPNIEIRLSTTLKDINFGEESIDMAIYYGNSKWSDLHKDFLFSDYLFPVCNKNYLAEKKITLHPKYYAQLKFIYVTADLRKEDWPAWCNKAGLPEPPKASRLYFAETVQALQAAQAGIGIALGHQPFVQDAIQQQQLIIPHTCKLKLDNSYYLVYPQATQHLNKIKKFKNWLLQETKTSVTK